MITQVHSKQLIIYGGWLGQKVDKCTSGQQWKLNQNQNQ